jgi:type II secretory pathway component GspD/PulD (secretin)
MQTPKHSCRAFRWTLVAALPLLALVAGLTAAPRQQSADGSGPAPGVNHSPPTLPSNFKPDPKKAKEAYRRGAAAERDEDWQAAYDAYSQAAAWEPQNREYMLRREVSKGRLIQAKIDWAEKAAVSGRLGEARKELREARYLDPSDELVRERLAQLAGLEGKKLEETPQGGQLVSEIRIAYQSGTRNFNFRGDTQGLFEEIAQQFGLDAAFDADLHPRQVRFQVTSADFPTAMELASDATHTFWHPLTSHLFFVAEDTQQKRREYEPLIVRTIVLPAAETPDELTELSRLVREVAGILRVDLDQPHRTLTLRASPRAMAVASDLIDNLEKPAGELILEMEILEVDRNYAREIGITPPQTAQTFGVNSNLLSSANSEAEILGVLEQIFGTPSSLSGLTPDQIATEIASGQLNVNSLVPPVIAFGGGKTTFFSTLPGASASLSRTLSLVRSGRRVLLRAQDGQPATFFAGERYPVSLGQYSTSLLSGTNTTTITSQNFPVTTLTTGNAPAFVTAASLRNDNIQDVIVSNHADDTISVFLGNGDGTFAAPVTYATGIGPTWMATGDFNNDGNIDLVVVNKGANTISVLLGNGDGTFKARTDFPTGAVPVSVVAGDFNGDGNLDVAVANQSDNTISLLFGDGRGNLSPPAQLSPALNVPGLLATGRAPTALAVGDFNLATYASGPSAGTSILDLVVANQSDNTVSVFIGNGDGSFKTPTAYPTGVAPVYVATSDFNGDGIPDLAVANFTDNTVSILLGQAGSTGTANGTFGTRTNYTAGSGPTSIAVADYSLDGIEDLAVTDSSSNTLSLLFGLPGGTFNANYELNVGTDPLSVVTADFNGSGAPDVAVANNGSNTVSVILNSTSASTLSNGGEGTQFPGSEYLDIGLKIKATPRIHPNDEVTLQLQLDLTSLAGQNFNSIPVINNDSIEQTVRLKENETTALAGILEPSITRALTGNPGIADVPGLGTVLSNQNIQEQDTQLLILITPRVVRLAPRKNLSIYAGHGTSEASLPASGRFERGITVPQPLQPLPPPAQPQNQPPL